MASWQYKVSLYGREGRISDSDLRRARRFHIYAQAPRSSQFVRLSDSLVEIPSYIRSNADKEHFIDLVAQELVFLEVEAQKEFQRRERALLRARQQEEERKRREEESRKRRERRERAKAKAEQEERENEEILERASRGEAVKLPEERPALEPIPSLPERKVKFTFRDMGNIKVDVRSFREFHPRARRILFDVLDGQGIPYEPRYDVFIKMIYQEFSKRPELALDPEFYENFITRHMGKPTIQDKEMQLKERADFWSTFNDKPRSDVGSPDLTVIFRMKEVKVEERYTGATRDQAFTMQEERQLLLLQAVGEYSELISIGRVDIKNEVATDMVAVVKDDIRATFNLLLEKGYFKFGNDTGYLVRLFVPLHDGQGIVKDGHRSKNGIESGGGYSLPRVAITDADHLDDIIEMLFSGLFVDMDDYIKRSRMSGFVLGGFMIERLVSERGGNIVAPR